MTKVMDTIKFQNRIIRRIIRFKIELLDCLVNEFIHNSEQDSRKHEKTGIKRIRAIALSPPYIAVGSIIHQ